MSDKPASPDSLRCGHCGYETDIAAMWSHIQECEGWISYEGGDLVELAREAGFDVTSATDRPWYLWVRRLWWEARLWWCALRRLPWESPQVQRLVEERATLDGDVAWIESIEEPK